MKGKKILLVGLGILGGGVATARFLLKQGAKLAITDKRDKNILQPSLNRLPKNISYTIGKHVKRDFLSTDIVVANPAVPRFGEWITYAEKIGKTIYNDLTLFLFFFVKKRKEYIAVTGTRGKTTSSLWIHTLISDSVLGGNIPEKALLKILSKRGNPFVLETSSFQLEYMVPGLQAPKVALITNLYQDHLNRHGTMQEYVRVKANIFLNQTPDDYLVLNADNEWTQSFLAHKPKSAVYYISNKPISKKCSGLYVSGGHIYFQEQGVVTKIARSPYRTQFENSNLLGALLVSFLYLRSQAEHQKIKKNDRSIWKELIVKSTSLPQAHMRREVIVQTKQLVVVNDSAGTSPEATIALLDAYNHVPKKELFLITGGTDKQLDFSLWARAVNRTVLPTNLYVVSGSATEKMKKALTAISHSYIWREYETLQDIMKEIASVSGKKTVLFSPSSASFEKYKNEFDRGTIFARLVGKFLQ